MYSQCADVPVRVCVLIVAGEVAVAYTHESILGMYVVSPAAAGSLPRLCMYVMYVPLAALGFELVFPTNAHSEQMRETGRQTHQSGDNLLSYLG